MSELLERFTPPSLSDVTKLEREVFRQLKDTNKNYLKVLGFGAFSIAIAYPKATPRWAFKRLPPNKSKSDLERYRRDIDLYVKLLESVGTRVVPSSIHIAPAAGRRGYVLYIAQPVLPAETLVPNVLRARTPDANDEVLTAVIESIRCGTTSRVGTDGNFANWAWLDGQLWHFDISTPLIQGPDFDISLAVTLLLRPYLILARPYLRYFVAPKAATQYHDTRHAIVEAIGMLTKERLSHWIPAAVEAANRVLDKPMTVEEAKKAFETDRALDVLGYRLRLAQRSLVRMVGQTYQFLMPPPPTQGDDGIVGV